MTKRYNLYIDESGVANLLDYHSRFFLLSAIIIEERPADFELTSYLNYIKRKYGLSDDENFHAFGVFEDRRSPFYLEGANIKKFCNSISEFVEIAPFKIAIFCIDKNGLRELLKMPRGYQFLGGGEHREDKELGYEILARAIFFEFARFLKEEKARGAIIAESRKGADYRMLRTFLSCQEKDQFSHSPRLYAYAQELTQRVVSICFENKKGMSGGLEMADLVSYVAYQKVSKKMRRLKARGIGIVWDTIQRHVKKEGFSPPLSNGAIRRLAKDRIHKASKRIQERLRQYRDLVNPTQR